MSDINEVVDHVTVLHIDSTVHWHSYDNDYKQNWLLLNTWIVTKV